MKNNLEEGKKEKSKREKAKWSGYGEDRAQIRELIGYGFGKIIIEEPHFSLLSEKKRGMGLTTSILKGVLKSVGRLLGKGLKWFSIWT